MRIALTLLLLLAAAPLGADWIFKDGFECGSDQFWTGPFDACRTVDDQPAPLCEWSMDAESWLAFCEMWPVVRCRRNCVTDSGTGDACLDLQAPLP